MALGNVGFSVSPFLRGLPTAEVAALADGGSGIVVLDPDPGSREAACRVLATRGHRVASTPDARGALLSAREGRLDLLLVDTGLGIIHPIPRRKRRKTDPETVDVRPASRGYAVLRDLGPEAEDARFPAVFVEEERDGVFGRSSGLRFAMTGFVPRPFTTSALLAAVEGALPLRGHRPCHGDREPPFEGFPPALLKALVVDGDVEYQQFLRRLLEPRGFVVQKARNGSEGLQRALASRPWLILTEVNVPGMDGFELCRRVRSHRLLRHTPLVFLSAWDGCDERLHGLKLGAHDYLSKRLPGRELLIRLHLVLRRYLDAGTPLPSGAGMEGSIELIGPTGLLQICHLGRFSGVCTLRTGMLRIQIRFRDGEIVGADSGNAHGAPAVYDLLSWTRGRFDLTPGDPGEGTPLAENFEYLLLEGCRRLDEDERQH